MIENMDRQLFITRVFDYLRRKEWDYQDNMPCVIDFHDDACPPCRLTEPILHALADEFAGRVRFYKVDTAMETTLAKDLGIKNLPTIVLCPIGDRPTVMLGATGRDKLRRAIEKKLLHESGTDRIISEGESKKSTTT